MGKNILVTGGTGFLGYEILKILIRSKKDRIYLLIRNKSGVSASRRFNNLLKKIEAEKINLKNRVHMIEGDLSVIDNSKFKFPLKKINEAFHCAALLDFNPTWKEAKEVNILGTKKLLNALFNNNNFEKFNYVSSLFVAGNSKCIFSECDFNKGQIFNNFYEKSKFEAEKIVRAYKHKRKRVKVNIFRPSMITGEYETGITWQFKLFYQALHLFSKEIFKKIPLDPKTSHNLIPVDLAAEAIYLLSKTSQEFSVFHIQSPESFTLDYFFGFAADYFGFSKPDFVPYEEFNMRKLTRVQRNLLEPFVPYFNYKVSFSGKDTIDRLRKAGFIFPSLGKTYLEKIFKFIKTREF